MCRKRAKLREKLRDTALQRFSVRLLLRPQEAYAAYRQAVFQQRLADENMMAAQISRDAAIDQLELGPWAP